MSCSHPLTLQPFGFSSSSPLLQEISLRKIISWDRPGPFLPSLFAPPAPLYLQPVCCQEQRQGQLKATKMSQTFSGLVLPFLSCSEMCFEQNHWDLLQIQTCSPGKQCCSEGFVGIPVVFLPSHDHYHTAGTELGMDPLIQHVGPWADFAFAVSSCGGAGCAEARHAQGF